MEEFNKWIYALLVVLKQKKENNLLLEGGNSKIDNQNTNSAKKANKNTQKHPRCQKKNKIYEKKGPSKLH
jgi:hypothetical protein